MGGTLCCPAGQACDVIEDLVLFIYSVHCPARL